MRNTANRDGGGLSMTLSRVTLMSTAFTGCTSLRGAALRVRDSRVAAGGNHITMRNGTVTGRAGRILLATS